VGGLADAPDGGGAGDEAELAGLFGFQGEVVPGVRFAGTQVTAVIRPDHAEVRRRERTGLSAVLDFDLTERLADLPVDLPTPRSSLDAVSLRLLDAATAGVVEHTDSAVIRRWRPAVTLTGIFSVAGRQWRAALHNVSLFAPDAPRGLALRRPPGDVSGLRSEARDIGVGVITADANGSWQLLLEPQREAGYDLGPRHWRLLEITYLAWRRRVDASSAVQLFR
jgi:hypothetical protein